MRRSLSLLVVPLSLSGLFSAPATAAGTENTTPGTRDATSQQGQAESRALSEKTSSTAAQTREYWTPERMREALANPMDPPVASPDVGRSQKPKSPDGDAGNGGDSGDSGKDKRARLSAHAVPPRSVRADSPEEGVSTLAQPRSDFVKYPSSWPNTATGKLFFKTPQGGKVCSASVIVSDTKNAVWTAAHCLHGGKDSGFYTDFKFVPAYAKRDAPWGEWYADRVIVPQAWSEEADLRTDDMGALVMKKHPTYGTLQASVGAYGYDFGDTDHSDVSVLGYPVDGYRRPTSDFADGRRMMSCQGDTSDASNWNPLDDRLGIDCDMGHGSSGGPFLDGVDDGDIQIVGTHSHRAGGLEVYSAEHGDRAEAVIDLVNN
ncbi:trypsin-like serine peptidase [Streptomyces spongiae]|uniref:Trypsin-like serine protease n=1 Tax=Streptomyces spongiae TaxID=565072 RepID=A0A5N8XR88_9ACTN|nr:hypothetical protein [Streptomyces spongiae]MPY61933.1 hypothetical protein [Streptomyces spongiae]